MDCLITTDDVVKKVFKISPDFLDGSIYLTILRKNGQTKRKNYSTNTYEDTLKRKRISYHATGMVNYHDLPFDPIFNEPIYDLKNHFLFFAFQCKDFSDFETVNDKNIKPIGLPKKKDSQYYRFSFLIGPSPKKNCISYTFYGGLFFISVLVEISGNLSRDALPFEYIAPQRDIRKKIDPQKSTVFFHQKLNNTSGIIIYQCDDNGLFTMVFHEVRRSIPKSEKLIKFKNDDYITSFTSIKEHYAKFKIKSKKSGQIINDKNPEIVSILLDNEL